MFYGLMPYSEQNPREKKNINNALQNKLNRGVKEFYSLHIKAVIYAFQKISHLKT